jgi:hypothetical protein
MKKNLFFFLLAPMVACAMEKAASGEQTVPEGQPVPGAPVVSRKNTPVVARKALRQSLLMRIKDQEPTEEREDKEGDLKRIPSDGELTRAKVGTVYNKLSSGELKLAKLTGEPRHDSKK